MKRIGYYKSCSLEGSSKDYARSLEMVFEALGIRLEELHDWNCCGASSAHATSELLGLALPARNLALAEKQGLSTLLAPCSACYSRMLVTAEKMRKDVKVQAEVNETIAPLNYLGTVQVKNILEVLLTEVGVDEILHARKKNLNGIRVACYYGCYLTRNPGAESFDDVENPQSMEKLVRMLGAEPVDWGYKTDCCGASFALSQEDYSVGLCRKIYEMAFACGAQALVATCPLCQTNLDLNQDRLVREKALPYRIPVFYITDLLGVALGCDLGSKQWRMHFQDTRDLLSRHALT